MQNLYYYSIRFKLRFKILNKTFKTLINLLFKFAHLPKCLKFIHSINK